MKRLMSMVALLMIGGVNAASTSSTKKGYELLLESKFDKPVQIFVFLGDDTKARLYFSLNPNERKKVTIDQCFSKVQAKTANGKEQASYYVTECSSFHAVVGRKEDGKMYVSMMPLK